MAYEITQKKKLATAITLVSTLPRREKFGHANGVRVVYGF